MHPPDGIDFQEGSDIIPSTCVDLIGAGEINNAPGASIEFTVASQALGLSQSLGIVAINGQMFGNDRQHCVSAPSAFTVPSVHMSFEVVFTATVFVGSTQVAQISSTVVIVPPMLVLAADPGATLSDDTVLISGLVDVTLYALFRTLPASDDQLIFYALAEQVGAAIPAVFPFTYAGDTFISPNMPEPNPNVYTIGVRWIRPGRTDHYVEKLVVAQYDPLSAFDRGVWEISSSVQSVEEHEWHEGSVGLPCGVSLLNSRIDMTVQRTGILDKEVPSYRVISSHGGYEGTIVEENICGQTRTFDCSRQWDGWHFLFDNFAVGVGASAPDLFFCWIGTQFQRTVTAMNIYRAVSFDPYVTGEQAIEGGTITLSFEYPGYPTLRMEVTDTYNQWLLEPKERYSWSMSTSFMRMPRDEAPTLRSVQSSPDQLGNEAVTSDDIGDAPEPLTLVQSRPNPFNSETTIEFELPKAGEVSLTIYNILGQEVASLVNETRAAGRHSLTWNGLDDSGQEVTSGVYLYRLRVGDLVQTKKMILLK